MRNTLLLPITLALALTIGGCPQTSPTDGGTLEPVPLHIFHNGAGPMCVQALDWLANLQTTHPELSVTEHLTFEADQVELLLQLEAQYGTSQGVSEDFGYLPIIFFQNQAFSGFNDDIATTLDTLLAEAQSTQ